MRPTPISTCKRLEIDVSHGPAAARNLGWKSTSTPYVAFTDDDCIAQPSWLRTGLEWMRADPDLGVVQGQDQPVPVTSASTPSSARSSRRGRRSWRAANIFYRRDAYPAA